MSEGQFVTPSIDYETLDHADPRSIVEWACGTIERLAVATSFQSSGMVILHLITQLRPETPVLFLDTGFHFTETLEFRDRVKKMWDLNLIDLRGTHENPAQQAGTYGPALYRRDPDKCCFINKVEPLQRALENYDGWISGIRRDQSPLRAHTPIVEAQTLPSGNEVLKIHPLANWERTDVQSYMEKHDIPSHPLLERGFPSIGCWPCTQRVEANGDERSGRWNGFSKTECGIHAFGKPDGPRETEAEQ
jgi:phosphoadenosine phosphosulfate reductase